MLAHFLAETCKALAGASETTCKRKSVGCAIIDVHRVHDELISSCMVQSVNGPTSVECSGVVGYCGCMHAEPRAIMALLMLHPDSTGKRVLLCSYSPCTACAHMIVHSEAIDGVIYETLTEHDTRGLAILKAAMPVLSVEDIDPPRHLHPSEYDAQRTDWERMMP